jgi:hypothetical protein
MDKLASHVMKKFAAMFEVGDIILYGKYKNKKGKLVSFGKNDKGQPTIEIEPIPKGRKKNKVMGLYKIWTATKEDAAAAKEQIKAEQAEKAKKASVIEDIDDPNLQQFAELFAKGLSDRKILQTMDITLNEAHAMANQLRDILGLTPMDNLRKTLKMMRQADLSQRVAARFVTAFGIPLGKTWDNGTVRVHRFRDVFQIWDLTNAGKRGKKVKMMSVSPSYSYKGDRDQWMESMSKALPDYSSYGRVKAFFSDILVDYPGEINIDEREVRGIDVNPGGSMEIRLSTNTGLEITSDPMEFMVKTHVPIIHPQTGKPTGHFQDTLYWSKKKEGASIFHNWLQANLSAANTMTILEFVKLWDDLGIRWDSH